MSKLSIYLAGPITGLGYDDKNSWRQDFKLKWGEKFDVRNPLDRDFLYENMDVKERFSAIANDERVDILNCDVTIAYLDKVSMGTAMGIMYAYLSGRTVVVVTSITNDKLSPMVKHHSHYLFDNFEKAVECIEKRHSRSSISSIRKRDGRIVEWDQKRIHDAIKAAIDEVYADGLDEKEFPRLRADKLAHAVIMQIEDDLDEGRLSRDGLHVEKVQDKIEKILIDNAHRGEVRNLAKAYIIFRRIQQEARESKSSQDEIMKFVEDIIHDIKAPVGNIERYIKMVQTALNTGDFEKAKERLKSAQKNNDRVMSEMINSKSKAEKKFLKTKENLHNYVNEMFNNFKDQNITFHNRVPNFIDVEASPDKLKTVFENLIDNSIKYGLDGNDGNIFIQGRKSDHGNFLLEYWNDGNGITKEKAESMFSGVRDGTQGSENFHHGMTQVRRYIEELGGSIECRLTNRIPDNQNKLMEPLKQGFPVFRIKLPLCEDKTDSLKRILVADDNEDDREMMRGILEEGGFEVIEAGSIDDALQEIENKQIYGATLDVDFGEDRNGIWLLKQIQKKRNGIKVIVVSGSKGRSNGVWRLEAEKNGALGAFDKGEYTEDQILRVFLRV